MKVKLSWNFSHRFLNCDDFFNVWRWEGVERELTMGCSNRGEDVVGVKPLKITKAGVISSHLISQISFLNFKVLFHADSDKFMSSTGSNAQNCRRNIARKQKNI